MEEDILNNDEFWKELGIDPVLLESEDSAGEKNEEENSPETSPQPREKEPKAQAPAKPLTAGRIGLTLLAVVLCVVLTAALLGGVVMMTGGKSAAAMGSTGNAAIMDKFDMIMTNEISNALDGVLSIEKVYWLSDSDVVAPKANPANYGTVTSPAELASVLEAASELIGDQKLLFNEATPVWEKDSIYYYYDETILVITWKQIVEGGTYTISEVKIAHPSQFRRFLAEGKFGSDKLYVTTDMAASVNAVVATSGDYYRYRRNGAVVYEGQLRRFEGEQVDTCFINEEGDLLFACRGDLKSEEQAIKFVEDNKVRFSLAFGPILVDEGVACPPARYILGEINDVYTRAALCQMGDLHYLLVSAGGGGGTYEKRHTIAQFAYNLESFGVEKAYALDGGQTTVIAMDGQMINSVDFGFQRQISDIIYFATALPEGE